MWMFRWNRGHEKLHPSTVRLWFQDGVLFQHGSYCKWDILSSLWGEAELHVHVYIHSMIFNDMLWPLNGSHSDMEEEVTFVIWLTFFNSTFRMYTFYSKFLPPCMPCFKNHCISAPLSLSSFIYLISRWQSAPTIYGAWESTTVTPASPHTPILFLFLSFCVVCNVCVLEMDAALFIR